MKTQWRDEAGVIHIMAPEDVFGNYGTWCNIEPMRYFSGRSYAPHTTSKPPTCFVCIRNMMFLLGAVMIVERETVRVVDVANAYPEIFGSTDLVHRACSPSHAMHDNMRLIPCAGWWISGNYYQTVGTYPTCIQCIAARI